MIASHTRCPVEGGFSPRHLAGRERPPYLEEQRPALHGPNRSRLVFAFHQQELGGGCGRVAYDCVICPKYQPLVYHATNRDGYREYCSDPEICAQCSTWQRCTRSKNCVETVPRHVGLDYGELAGDARHTLEYKGLYAKHKGTVERTFADAKGKHGMCYTLYSGLAQVSKMGEICCHESQKAGHAENKTAILPPFPAIFRPYLPLPPALSRSMWKTY